MSKAKAAPQSAPGPDDGPAQPPLEFFGKLKWLDGRPLVDTIEDYRKQILTDVLFTFGPDGAPIYNMALCGRAKKNWKTSDLVLAGLYRFVAWPSPAGNDAYILANDEGQAADDLALVKKLITANPVLQDWLTVNLKSIVRKDGRGTLQILPARDAVGAHGKTFTFVGFDEIHGYRSHDLFEALAPDPTRRDVLTWITSYAGIRHAPGIPLYDFMQAGKLGDDPGMYFSWYGGDYTTDPAFAELPPEQRANPSMSSWPTGEAYLTQQRRRLPTHKFRRLHLNLPGAPDGAAFSGEHVMAATVTGRKRLAPVEGVAYYGFVDMSGGSADDAVLGIAHHDPQRKVTILDHLIAQTGEPPFNPRSAVKKFAAELKEYGLSRVTGDAYAGQTFRADFEEHGIVYVVCGSTKSDLYDALEPKLNAGEVELLDHPKLQEQLLTLVLRGAKIDHLPGDHDDHANSAAGAVWLAVGREQQKMWPNGPIFVHEQPRGSWSTEVPGGFFDIGGDASTPPGGW
ncbi:Phage terminase-like protein, large subunit, contains N-terminal HTH domain [Rhizobiales bacterium GAS188]|nr:Phage terminase-like protein, large subunit, contains N-terminal HTH domain [Rhizobiales bacterium GAS188]